LEEANMSVYSGKVVDSDNHGVSDATVTVSNAKTGAVLSSTTSRDDGTFLIEAPLEDVNFSASKAGAELACIDVKVISNSTSDVGGPDVYGYTWS